ncbi:MAG: hypothetical protein EXR72_17300 [Myxococcales bacterium]|nr:hypothetical protein [Myxococcales bacterium]
MRRLWLLVCVCAIPTQARAQACFGNLNRQTYPGGFQGGDFSRSSNTRVNNGSLELSPGQLDPERIVLPFDQDVAVDYVYESAGGSHTLGWFYYDQVQPFLDQNGNLVDNDGDGVLDFFQSQSPPRRPREGLFRIGPGRTLPDLLDAGTSYSDGGTLPHIPNLLESFLGGGSNPLVFLLCDDDGDLSTGGGFPPLLPPIGDLSVLSDGIPDYDVNGDGIVGNPPDRTANLGTIQGNREVVFFLMMYYDQRVKRDAVGLPGVGTALTKIMPFFSKSALNPDRGAVPPNATVKTIDIGCSYPGSCSGVSGWLDAATITRLNTPAYRNLVLPHESKSITSGPQAFSPHLLVGAPSTDPDRWLIGVEDLVIYDNASCPTCTHSDRDYNDVVFLIQTELGGSATSQPSASEIPPPKVDDYTITKIRVRWSGSYPAPCLGPPTTRIDLYYSLDDGVTWHPVTFPASSPNEAMVDVLAQGFTGSRLRWKTNFITSTPSCHPVLNQMKIGYEAVRAGEYQETEVLPLVNAVLRAFYETSASTWTVTGGDRSLRGHLKLHRLYNPDLADAADSPPLKLWDAGELLAVRAPDTRAIYYGAGTAQFTVGTGPPLFLGVLPLAARSARVDNQLVYDLTGDGVVDDADAAAIVQWTRGFELPVSGNQPRAWKLGAIRHSTPAIVGPPGSPDWVRGGATPSAETAAYSTFAAARRNRATIAVVGAADGMLHAFRLGEFRIGDDAGTASVEKRGYFAKVGGQRDYGAGTEAWAWVPPAQLDKLKNNLPSARVAAYQSGSNPRASVDGALGVADAYVGGAVKTVLLGGQGANHPYLSALDVTDPGIPRGLWAADWTDVDFNGTFATPSMGPVKMAAGRVWAAASTSGLAESPGDLYLYRIDLTTGVTLQKTKLNIGAFAAPAYGSVDSPVMIDSDLDGVIDRIYLADTSGRVLKVDTASNRVCLLADIGESVFAPIAVSSSDHAVRIYVAGGDHPEIEDPAAQSYHLVALEDRDAGSACSPATQLFRASLPSGHRAWARPTIGGDNVYVTTSTSERQSICSPGPEKGVILGFGLNGASLFRAVAIQGGDAVGGLRSYDGHLFVNSLDGSTTMVGAPAWNNDLAGVTRVTLPTVGWSEY